MNLRFFSAFTLLFLISQTSFAQVPNWQWAKSAGGIDYSGGYSIATDAKYPTDQSILI